MTIPFVSKIPAPSQMHVLTATTNHSPIAHTTHQPCKQTNLPALLPTPNLPIRCLTPAELRDKREKRLCYHCDQKYNTHHPYCIKFFILMGTDDDDTENNKEFAMVDHSKRW